MRRRNAVAPARQGIGWAGSALPGSCWAIMAVSRHSPRPCSVATCVDSGGLSSDPVLTGLSMRDDFVVEQIRAALRSMDDESPEEWFTKMERLGILDAEGNVLRRMPEPPEETEGNNEAT